MFIRYSFGKGGGQKERAKRSSALRRLPLILPFLAALLGRAGVLMTRFLPGLPTRGSALTVLIASPHFNLREKPRNFARLLKKMPLLGFLPACRG
jgi:hypothetical protein